jgi:hypothetical protein
MKGLSIVVALLLGALLPAQAFAAICFQVTLAGAQPSPTDTVILLELEGPPAGGYFNLVGAAAFTADVVIPLNGSAYLRQDGLAHFGAISYALSPPDITPYSVTGLLEPPAFDSGPGFIHWSGSNTNLTADVTFSGVSCPARP